VEFFVEFQTHKLKPRFPHLAQVPSFPEEDPHKMSFAQRQTEAKKNMR